MNSRRREPYVPPYNRRKDFCRKIRDTEAEVRDCKEKGMWYKASRLMYKLRKSWWGYKRYK